MSRTTAPPAVPRQARLDVGAVRRDFPVLAQTVHGRPLVYLDSAASAQKPEAVVEAVAGAYRRDYSNVHRGVHTLSQRATDAYERARDRMRTFLGAANTDEIVFVRGTTEAVNLVAWSFARPRLAPGDRVLISGMEHHSNIVPWQLVCQASGAELKVVPIDERGDLDLESLRRLLSDRVRILSLVHVSNALGTINPVQEVVELAHQRGVPVFLDGAQAAPHLALDVRRLGCDFYAISGHKMFGPTGIGVLYGRREILASMAPYQGGGEMIRSVSFDGSEYQEPPHRFEAGTPHIAGAVGLAAAADYLEAVGFEAIGEHEHALLEAATRRLAEIPEVRLVGTARRKAAVVSFVLEGVHAHDVGTILDQEGIAVRAGHHCAQPVMERFGVAATTRASFALYNTAAEVAALEQGVRSVLEVFGRCRS